MNQRALCFDFRDEKLELKHSFHALLLVIIVFVGLKPEQQKVVHLVRTELLYDLTSSSKYTFRLFKLSFMVLLIPLLWFFFNEQLNAVIFPSIKVFYIGSITVILFCLTIMSLINFVIF